MPSMVFPGCATLPVLMSGAGPDLHNQATIVAGAGTGDSSAETQPAFHAQLLAGSGPGLSSEIRSLLRARLRAISLIILLALAAFAIRSWLLPEVVIPRTLQTIVLGLLAAVTVILYSRRDLDLRQLRFLEVFVVLLITLYLALATLWQIEELGERYGLFSDDSMAQPLELLFSALAGTVFPFVWLLMLYGMLIPNTWKRAAAVMAPVAIAPFAIRALARVLHPELGSVVSLEQFTYVLGAIAVGYASGVYGTHIINTLRVEAFEARKMGQYRLVEKIGEGGMGEVWRAKHRMLARPAAIKLIRPDMLGTADPGLREMILHRFEREAQATAALTSPHSIMLYDFGISEDQIFYYVMEFLEGLDLESLVEQFGPVPPARAISLLMQACESLSDAHQQGLIHRDIKPTNIFVCRMGRRFDFVKVLDFGLVKSRESEQRSVQLTQAGAATGTPAFMSPEQAVSGEVDARTDLYALGCIGYWLLTGHLVFQGDSVMATLIDHVKTTPPRPSSRINLPIPEDLEGVIMLCLEKEPEKRPQSADQLADMLAGCADAGKWDSKIAARWWSNHT